MDYVSGHNSNQVITKQRYGRVDTLAKIMREDLMSIAELTGRVFPISILLSNQGWTRQLVYAETELICELNQERFGLIVNLRMDGKFPIGPWSSEHVLALFNYAGRKKVVVPEGVVMPSIIHYDITPNLRPETYGEGFDLDILFDSINFGSKRFETQTDLVARLINNEFDSWDCCHFFTDRVLMFFPWFEPAQNALKRVKKVCPG